MEEHASKYKHYLEDGLESSRCVKTSRFFSFPNRNSCGVKVTCRRNLCILVTWIRLANSLYPCFNALDQARSDKAAGSFQKYFEERFNEKRWVSEKPLATNR